MADGQTLSIIPSVAGGAGAAAPAAALPALDGEEIKRYSRHLILSEVGMEGQQKLKAAKVLCIGAGGLGSPVAMYLAAAGVGTIGIVDFDTVDLSNLQRQILHGTDRHRPLQAGLGEGHAAAPQPAREGGAARGGAQLAERARPLPRLRRDRRRHRQLPDALPGQRRLRAARHPQRLRQHLPLRGPGVGLRHQGRPVLPLPVSGAAAAGAGAQLRRGRRARHPARAGRHHPGHRDGEADPRHRRDAGRPLPHLRRDADALPRAHAAQGPRLPGVRHAPDGDRAHRLRPVLRHRAGAGAAGADLVGHRHHAARAEGADGRRHARRSSSTCASRTNTKSTASPARC